MNFTNSTTAASGRWYRRGDRLLVDFGGGGSTYRQGEIEGEISEEIGSPNAVIDSRIDVHAQYALLRMSKNPGTAGIAAAMLAAVKGPVPSLAGIYKEDQFVPAQMAKRNGLGWWELLKPGQDAVRVADASSLPILIFRDSVRSDPSRLDPALISAFLRRTPTLVLIPPTVITARRPRP